MTPQQSRGQILAAQLSDSLAAFQMGPVAGDRARQIVWGVTPDGSFVDGMTLDGCLARLGQILKASGRLYRFGNTLACETDEPGDQHLTTVAVQHRAEPNAAPLLANLLGAGCRTRQGVVQSLAAPKLINAVLADESLWRGLPEIRYHGRRPTFDPDFNLCRPGWNAASGILVHAPEVIPTPPALDHAPEARAIDRIPPVTRGLLREFSWRSDADPVNALAMLLTGLLINHFVNDPHPGCIVNANQSGTGKTLMVQAFGRVLDDAEPPRTSLVRDEEVEKKLCAQLRTSRTSLYFLDNVRTRIESAVIEQNMLSPLLSFRILGRSANVERPNTFLWMITSNLTAGTTDFIRRCVTIRQFVEGDPKARVFKGNPLAYATRRRLEILGELAGMVLRWVERGRPPGPHRHRCDRWAAIVGGILDANGLGQYFLANMEEAEAAMDQGLLDLATLAEHVVSRGWADLIVNVGDDPGDKGRTPGLWLPAFAETQVLRDRLAESTNQGRATTIGIFLGGKLDRAVPVETPDGPRRATLRRREAGAGQKHYYFELATPAADDGRAAPAAGDPEAPGADVPAQAPVAPEVAERGSAPDAYASPGTDAAPTTDNAPAAGDLEWA